MAVRTVLRKITRRSPRPPKPPRERVAKPPATPKPKPPAPATPSHEPFWVRWFTDAGRPIVAIVVMTMCAPGEHHLGVLAGWDSRLAWGMAAVLAAYAGIAAVVATRRPKGAPGHRSAVAGAVISLGLAMSAQPVSHMFVTGHWSADPRAPQWLIVVVSCIPPLVLGHLLHLAAHAAPMSVPAAEQPETRPVPAAAPVPRRPAPWPVPVPSGATMLPIARAAAAPAAHPETPAETPQPQPDGEFLTTAEVASRLRVSASTVRTWVDRGKIAPALRGDRGELLFAAETLPAH